MLVTDDIVYIKVFYWVFVGMRYEKYIIFDERWNYNKTSAIFYIIYKTDEYYNENNINSNIWPRVYFTDHVIIGE